MQGVPITKNVREKFYEKNLTYVFDYLRDRFFEFNFTIRLAKIGEVTLARFSNKFSLHFLESFQRDSVFLLVEVTRLSRGLSCCLTHFVYANGGECCLQGVPIMENVREKIYEKNLTYVFYYGGVSINTIWVRDTFFQCTPSKDLFPW